MPVARENNGLWHCCQSVFGSKHMQYATDHQPRLPPTV
jgi:hypothetical protein